MSLTRRIPILAFALFLFLPCLLAGCARETPAEHAANVYAAQEMAAAPLYGNLPDYSLPPEKLVKAQHLAKVETTLHFFGVFWGIAQLALLLWLGVAAWIRDRAVGPAANLRERGKRFRAFWIECFVFTLLFGLCTSFLDLPLSLYGHHLSVEYGLSIQSWSSWFGDWGKTLGLGLVGGLLGYALLMFLIRCCPRSWWIVFWAVLMPILIFVIYGAPLYLDPLYNKFEPLKQSQPELVERLEKVVERGHMNIPPDRMFLMKASAKTTQLNAYVTGFGSSKRVVVWDTSIAKFTPDEVLMVFGHESGHYVLGHVRRGIVMVFAGLFVALLLGFVFVRSSITRFGTAWRIPAQSDWGAIVVLLFAFSILSAIAEPIMDSISRQQEHAADVYGEEAIHGIVADPQAAAQGSFDVLGVNSLVDPNPSPFIEFWTFNHPAIGRRAAFGKVYDPWAPGMEPKYFPK
jgi:Zn-dependent protease with chaperone function